LLGGFTKEKKIKNINCKEKFFKQNYVLLLQLLFAGVNVEDKTVQVKGA
jgi:hypothetical protein